MLPLFPNRRRKKWSHIRTEETATESEQCTNLRPITTRLPCAFQGGLRAQSENFWIKYRLRQKTLSLQFIKSGILSFLVYVT